MRVAATCLLGGTLALLLVCIVYEARYPWLGWVRAFAEAGTAGAIADWYAVVALFRHPLGVPIPHTAIIPRNQQRIAESLGQFVEDNFLAPELITARLQQHNASQALAQWLADRANSEAVADVVVGSLPGLLNAIDEDDMARFIDRIVIPRLRTLDVSRAAGQMLRILAEGERHQPFVERGLRALEQWLVDNAGLLKAKFSEASRYTPARFDGYIVDRFVEGIVTLVHEVVENPEHALRRQFDGALRDLAVQLQMSSSYRRLGKSLMRDCIRYFRQTGYSRVLLDHARSHVMADLGATRPAAHGIATALLVSLGHAIAGAPAIQHKLNAWWLELAHTLVVRYRGQLSALIVEVVKSWNAREVSRKIEAQIGRDLQYVRINGTLVGGTVGVLLHAAAFAVAR
ncbi:hypothetical protein CI15_29625 [Paraburkholderia monticola]|uniref:DUF445 domain-containing protein n=2 Tax=Paraburkholderia monticola TaxID=1399968 RepID=A0A149PDY7_9BURK|nr:hypothetical protein CI15_29625 [Paraburkholderia monticola]